MVWCLLGAVCVWSRVSHGHDSRLSMLQVKVLVLHGKADTLSAGSVNELLCARELALVPVRDCRESPGG